MMSPDIFAAAAKLIGVLILIVGGLLAFNVYSRRFLKGGPGSGSKAVQVLESTPVGLKKAVTLVKVPGAVLVVGITNERISLLDRLPEDAYLSAVDNAPTRPAMSFQDHLRRFSVGGTAKRAASDTTSAAEASSC